MKKLIPVLAAITISGCATVFEGGHQDFSVATYSDNAPEDTKCTLTNEEGEWRVIAHEVSAIHRDGNEMQITCENDSQVGEGSVKPRFQVEYLVLDIIWDACILTASCIIDGATNAFFEYPDSISIEMKDKVQAAN